MKSLKITVTHGRIYTVETSSGVRAQSSTLAGALDHLVPHSNQETRDWRAIEAVVAAIPDSGGDGIVGRGRASG